MLYHNTPAFLAPDNRIYLEDKLRNPLGIGQNATIYASLKLRNDWGAPEIMITAYPYDSWPDLWNLSLQLRDQPGQIERLMKIFDECGVIVQYYSARTAYKSPYHSKYFVLDCSAYEKSEIDLTPEQRHENPYSKLEGLYYNILIEFLHEIRIKYDGEPRIKLTRNLLHLNMWQHTVHRDKETDKPKLALPKKVKLSKGFFLLPDEWVDQLKVDDSWHYVSSVNLKSYALYCAFLNSDEKHIVHMKLYYKMDSILLAEILTKLRKLNLNIIKTRMVFDSISREDNMPGWVLDGSDVATFNVMVKCETPINRNDLINQLNQTDFYEQFKNECFYAHLEQPRKAERNGTGILGSGFFLS